MSDNEFKKLLQLLKTLDKSQMEIIKRDVEFAIRIQVMKSGANKESIENGRSSDEICK